MKINEINPSFLIYMLGIVILGISYEFLKRSFDESWWFVGLAIVYLLALRLIADLVTRKWSERSNT
jgi:hypothetical protein